MRSSRALSQTKRAPSVIATSTRPSISPSQKPLTPSAGVPMPKPNIAPTGSENAQYASSVTNNGMRVSL